MALTDRFEGARFPATPPVPAAPEPVSAPRESAAAGRRRLPAGGRRSYAAGDINRLTDSFARTPMAFDVHVQQSQRVTRARSREAARNNPLIKRYLGLLVSNVIGADGIQLQSQPKDQDGKIDKLAADSIERAWREWGAADNCHLTRELDWTTMQRLGLRQIARDGELLIEETTGASGGPWAYSLRPHDPERLDLSLNASLPDGSIRMGIELDLQGRRRAYYLLERSAGEYASAYGSYRRRVPAEQMIHLFLREDVEQLRGMPWTAAALPILQQLGAYEEGTVVNARARANTMAFIETAEGADLSAVERDADGSPIETTEAATVKYLDPGEKLSSFDPSYPSGEFGPFTKAMNQRIASALETSYNSLASDLEGVNYSSIRQGVIDDRDLWRLLQGWLAIVLCQRVFNNWLLWSIASGKLQVPGLILAQLIDEIPRYRQARWQGRGWDWVDPVKDIVASKEAIALGVTTVSEIIRARGRDPEEVWAERRQELDTMAALGVQPPEPKLGAEQVLLSEGKEGQ